VQDIRPRGISDAKKKFYQLSIGAVYFSARKLLDTDFNPRAGWLTALIGAQLMGQEKRLTIESEQNQRDIERSLRERRLREECIEPMRVVTGTQKRNLLFRVPSCLYGIHFSLTGSVPVQPPNSVNSKGYFVPLTWYEFWLQGNACNSIHPATKKITRINYSLI
jgi:hypothetical protein